MSERSRRKPPSEVWVNFYDDGEPMHAYLTKDEAASCTEEGPVQRYVLAPEAAGEAMISDANRVLGKYMCSRHGCSLVSAVLTEMGGMCDQHASPLMFPIQLPYDHRGESRTKFVPWEFMRPHEMQARRNHGGQTLARLAERGGLCASEALAVVRGVSQYDVRLSQQDALDALVAAVDAWSANTGGTDGG